MSEEEALVERVMDLMADIIDGYYAEALPHVARDIITAVRKHDTDQLMRQAAREFVKGLDDDDPRGSMIEPDRCVDCGLHRRTHPNFGCTGKYRE